MNDLQARYSENDFWGPDGSRTRNLLMTGYTVIRRLRVRFPSGPQKSFSEYRAWRSFIYLTISKLSCFSNIKLLQKSGWPTLFDGDRLNTTSEWTLRVLSLPQTLRWTALLVASSTGRISGTCETEELYYMNECWQGQIKRRKIWHVIQGFQIKFSHKLESESLEQLT